MLNLTHRPRRLRVNAAMRSMVEEITLRPSDLVQPLFIIEGTACEAIESMPGCSRLSIESLLRECEALLQVGVKAIALFPRIDLSLKDAEGSEALHADNLVHRAIRAVKKNFPELLISADIALDPYTTHGHDGVLTASGHDVDNDRSAQRLAEMALLAAQAGADIVAPSDMMDGRIGAIRQRLDQHAFTNVGIIAYTGKYNSALYGPFRDAVGSSQAAGTANLSKLSYQLHPANRRQALRQAALDAAAGADMLMVKPASWYLDIISDFRAHFQIPIVAYQVSGEYAQIHAAAKAGWLSLERCMAESLVSIKRAGADLIFTYFAKTMAESLTHGGI